MEGGGLGVQRAGLHAGVHTRPRHSFEGGAGGERRRYGEQEGGGRIGKGQTQDLVQQLGGGRGQRQAGRRDRRREQC